jgi:hypothetical protein
MVTVPPVVTFEYLGRMNYHQGILQDGTFSFAGYFRGTIWRDKRGRPDG